MTPFKGQERHMKELEREISKDMHRYPRPILGYINTDQKVEKLEDTVNYIEKNYKEKIYEIIDVVNEIQRKEESKKLFRTLYFSMFKAAIVVLAVLKLVDFIAPQ